MKKKKRLRLYRGKAKELAKLCGVCEKTVTSALGYDNDTELQAMVRQKAREYGFVKKF